MIEVDLLVLAILLIIFNLILIGSLLGRRRRAVNAKIRQKEARMEGDSLQYRRIFGS